MNKVHYYIESNKFNISHALIYPQMELLTSTITETYAKHPQWLIKFQQELMGDSTRGYVFAMNYWNELIGVSLLKNSEEEKKICCLFVDSNYRGQGIASTLIEKSFSLLKTEQPFLTVAENNLYMLKKLLEKYNFKLTSIKEGMYKPGVKEYYYNEGVQR